MLLPSEISMLTATVGSGLTAGLCFTFASFIMASLDRLDAPQAIRAMQAINATILRSSAMAVWFGTAVVGVVAAALAAERTLAVAAAALYGIGAILITGQGNVPLNRSTKSSTASTPTRRAPTRHGGATASGGVDGTFSVPSCWCSPLPASRWRGERRRGVCDWLELAAGGHRPPRLRGSRCRSRSSSSICLSMPMRRRSSCP